MITHKYSCSPPSKDKGRGNKKNGATAVRPAMEFKKRAEYKKIHRKPDIHDRILYKVLANKFFAFNGGFIQLSTKALKKHAMM